MEKVTQIVQIEATDIAKRLMEVKGLTTAELSQKSGLSKNYINNLKKRKWIPIERQRLSTVKMLATNLDVPPQLFIKAPYITEKEE